jgi:isopenicillin-N N-acyltransferase like protein
MNTLLSRVVIVSACALLFTVVIFSRDDKPAALQSTTKSTPELFAKPDTTQGSGTRTLVGASEVKFPLVVVQGTPYAMGYHLGRLMKDEMKVFIPAALEGIKAELKVSNETLVEVWSRMAAYADQRVAQELAGLADGSGLPLSTLQAIHAVSILMPYSCSSVAAWGKATVDGHLYQTRNLDWSMEVKAHEFPMIVVYLPEKGIPHVVPSFAGIIGAHTGLNARGIALSEMGDASAKEMPYQVHAPHFTVYFRTMLYDGDCLTKALDIFQSQPMTKRYHFVFGDGQKELRAVKVLAHSPEPEGKRLKIWKDNDPTDEFAPNVMANCVYNDEGRGAFPTLQSEYGKLDAAKMIAMANKIPIKGGNVINAVYDATALKMWVSYASGKQEAYQRPYVELDLTSVKGFTK